MVVKMKTYYKTILKSKLFEGVDEKDLEALLKCISSTFKDFSKGEYIFDGDGVADVGLILTGSAHIVKNDFWGNSSILSNLEPGDIFGESYAYANYFADGISVIAVENSSIMFFDINNISIFCQKSCEFHNKLIKNMLSILALKNIMFTKKIDHMSKKTIREKILSYLSAESIKSGSDSFQIAYNRQELADFLSVDRSALSNELGKLRDDGVLTFHKNKFTLNRIIEN